MGAALWGMRDPPSLAPLLVSRSSISCHYNKHTPGNCFSSSFGGSCSGTPVGCRDCNEALKCRRKLKTDNSTKPGLPEYCAITPSHTMCQFKPGEVSERCGQVKTHKITEQIKQRLLDQHNELRRKVAKGEEPSQPAAANMMELVTLYWHFKQTIQLFLSRNGMMSCQIYPKCGQISVTAYFMRPMFIHASMSMVVEKKEPLSWNHHLAKT